MDKIKIAEFELPVHIENYDDYKSYIAVHIPIGMHTFIRITGDKPSHGSISRIQARQCNGCVLSLHYINNLSANCH